MTRILAPKKTGIKDQFTANGGVSKQSTIFLYARNMFWAAAPWFLSNEDFGFGSKNGKAPDPGSRQYKDPTKTGARMFKY